MVRLVREIGLETFLVGLADEIRKDFLRWHAFDKTARLAAHSADGVIELMPISDGHRYTFKYVNGHPNNTKQNLQTVIAFGLLADVASGYPLLLSEMTLLTAMRTAAMSALAARELYPGRARTMAMIGNGAQAEFQCSAFHAICGVKSFRAFDTDPAATEKLVRNLYGRGLELTACRTAEDAIEGADIITTCTADKRHATILTDNMVGPDGYINAIGGDCPGKTELSEDILRRAEIFVEFEEQTRVEGEIQQLPRDWPVTLLSDVLADPTLLWGRKRGLRVFDSVGFALQDFSALRFVYQNLEEHPYYERLDLLAQPTDPRDLFGLLTSTPC
jgi:ornithine cyclodeaminase